MILAGDIGGTKTNLGLFEQTNSGLEAHRQQSFVSRDHPSLDSIVSAFLLGSANHVDAACFGIAGPVLEGRSETPNLPWIVESQGLARLLRLDGVHLLNDLEATAYGISQLRSEELLTINPGSSQGGNRALVGAGTGFGTAALLWDGHRYHVSASEGGHVDFAPRNRIEIELLEFMLQKYSHVSVERVLSGPGLFNIYDFLRRNGYGREAPDVAERFKHEDPSGVISSLAFANESALAKSALSLFVTIYGAVTGNVALMLMATGGVYIGGGIAPKIKEKLADGEFLAAFTDKGRMSSLMESIPVHVILNDKTALLGAAHVASQMIA
jgi:glucokinase